jgi:hypothetical protein
MRNLIVIFLTYPTLLMAQNPIDSNVFIFNRKKIIEINYRDTNSIIKQKFNEKFSILYYYSQCQLNNKDFINTRIDYNNNGTIRTIFSACGNNEFELKLRFDKNGYLLESIVDLDGNPINILHTMDTLISISNGERFSKGYMSRQDTSYLMTIIYDKDAKRLREVTFFRNGKKFGCWLYFDGKQGLSGLINYYDDLAFGLKASFSRRKPLISATFQNNLRHGLYSSHLGNFRRKLSHIITYSNGVENGLDIRFYPNGTVFSIFILKDGKALNQKFFYSKGGKLK